jgi:hypothetical protein
MTIAQTEGAMNTLEKMARAICLASYGNYGKARGFTKDHDVVNREWPQFTDEAFAALEAMLEPSEAVRLAEAAFPRAEDLPLYAEDFRAMIQVALDGK